MDDNKNCFIACGEEIVNNGHCDCANRMSNELAEVGNAIGHSVNGDDMHWTVDCPKCDKEYEFKGYYESGETFTCNSCKHTFITSKVWIDENHYMQ